MLSNMCSLMTKLPQLFLRDLPISGYNLTLHFSDLCINACFHKRPITYLGNEELKKNKVFNSLFLLATKQPQIVFPPLFYYDYFEYMTLKNTPHFHIQQNRGTPFALDTNFQSP